MGQRVHVIEYRLGQLRQRRTGGADRPEEPLAPRQRAGEHLPGHRSDARRAEVEEHVAEHRAQRGDVECLAGPREPVEERAHAVPYRLV